MSPGRAVGYGALTVAVLDGLDAIVFFGLRGVSPTRIFQGIAAGLLGRQAAIQGGVATAMLGVALHFVVALGIVSTYYAASRKIRVLTVVDTLLRYSPVIDPRFSYRAEDVVAALEQACAVQGYPKTIRVDQGTEFVSRDLDLWAYAKGVTLDFSRPGKPIDTAFAEAFNGRARAECLNCRSLHLI